MAVTRIRPPWGQMDGERGSILAEAAGRRAVRLAVASGGGGGIGVQGEQGAHPNTAAGGGVHGRAAHPPPSPHGAGGMRMASPGAPEAVPPAEAAVSPWWGAQPSGHALWVGARRLGGVPSRGHGRVPRVLGRRGREALGLSGGDPNRGDPNGGDLGGAVGSRGHPAPFWGGGTHKLEPRLGAGREVAVGSGEAAEGRDRAISGRNNNPNLRGRARRRRRGDPRRPVPNAPQPCTAVVRPG